MSVFQKIAELFTGKSGLHLVHQLTERDLIERESEIGRQLFGVIPQGHKREFFCLDAKTWVWHEEWHDENNKVHTSTTRYEVQPNGILKAQPGRVYRYIEGEELVNLTQAIRLYYERSMREIYRIDPYTGQPIVQTPATMYS